jgi:hypothetical protein
MRQSDSARWDKAQDRRNRKQLEQARKAMVETENARKAAKPTRMVYRNGYYVMEEVR